ncbi:hypothetical protein TREMEDRAFT_56642 [Tremella mesenterica DSM 1558]|uniref:uncharacterized protein n=1 Tax=Tremella mesenterica (strain ATCC 24925 / CBS 8224 / DSM 1558 / NBRC 9311 / NRRL Y-6157 / RJB 2259-6 / UBC 559-6) TaxID=578456 RepID=UPI0003F49AF9|nr:uncharacterized protein TREMEDRAFT_56642 [Tremella mesenterica DSM 1558]EIW70701.1 hypothetical protein TREMEDRAFT_56642 [Tremella mesenterica DSM 1558]
MVVDVVVDVDVDVGSLSRCNPLVSFDALVLVEIPKRSDGDEIIVDVEVADVVGKRVDVNVVVDVGVVIIVVVAVVGGGT